MHLADLTKLLPSQWRTLLAQFAGPSGSGDNGRAKRLAGAVFFIRVLSATLAYGSQVLLARWMGGHEYGVYVYVWTWVLLLGFCVDLGLGSAAQRLIPLYVERRQTAHLRGFLFASYWMSIGASIVIGGLCAIVVWIVQPWPGNSMVIPLYLACLTLPAFAIEQIQNGIARSYDWIGLALAPPFVIRQALLVAIISAICIAGISIDASAAMLASTVSVWVTVLGALLVTKRRLNANIERGPKDYDFSAWFSVSLPILMVESVFLLLSCVDVLMLMQFATPDEVAVYHAAAKTLALVSFIHFAVTATTTHRFSRHHVTGDWKKLQMLLAQATQWTFWPSLAAIAILLAVGRPLLSLFGNGFSSGYPLMFILAVGLLARAAVGPAERLLSMIGEWRICVVAYVAAFILNLGLCAALIPMWSAAGAAIALSVALVAESALLFIMMKRCLRFNMPVFGGRAIVPGDEIQRQSTARILRPDHP